MKPYVLITLFLIIVCSCTERKKKKEKTIQNVNQLLINYNKKDKTETNLTLSQIEQYSKNTDSLNKKEQLIEFRYPNRSRCGGLLYGYYYNDKLLLVDATEKGEFGYGNKRMYFKNDNLYKIVHKIHVADLNQFKGNYPSDLSKVHYHDTTYIIDLGTSLQFKKKHKGKIVSTKNDTIMINQLIKCGFEMKAELETERIKE